MNRTRIFKALLLLPLILFTWSCSRSSDDTPEVKPKLEVKTVKNLHAPQEGGRGEPVSGEFTKFSFSKNSTVTGDDWDIAFRGTTIIVNGGAKIGITDEPERTGNAAVSVVNNTLEDVAKAPDAATFKQDATNTYAIPRGSGNGWYSYNMDNHMISPIAGKIFVVRTHDGKYAKFEVLSYYKDAPANPDPLTVPSEYYTFRFVYQPEGSTF